MNKKLILQLDLDGFPNISLDGLVDAAVGWGVGEVTQPTPLVLVSPPYPSTYDIFPISLR